MTSRHGPSVEPGTWAETAWVWRGRSRPSNNAQLVISLPPGDSLVVETAVAPSLRLQPIAIAVRSRDDFGNAFAEIVSARDLNAEEKHKLELQVKKVSGKSLRVTYAVDPKLMGGALVKVGSTVYDGSVRGQLQRIREQLATN